ncbi:hypothetical protein F2Q69_00013579 [Brassica cretica]|uniref:Aspartic peptidase DDI1-type domain-containing protein n=1 Tax=Brassica cretica TaxID=69181 RepID=A0A8S9QSD7_BRACR|nr:hypothetical protein F2Q69_00013579 [Brassica cretica]
MSDPGNFVVPYLIGCIDYPSALCDTGSSVSILPKRNSGGFIRNVEVQIGNALVPVDFHVLDIKLNWNSSLLPGIAFMATVGAVCYMQTNKLCLTLIDPAVYYDPVRVVKQHTCYMEIGDNPRFIALCHCDNEAEEESEAETSIATQHVISIDEKLVVMIDNDLKAPIDNDHVNEIDCTTGPATSRAFTAPFCNFPSFIRPRGCKAIPSKRKMSAVEPD